MPSDVMADPRPAKQIHLAHETDVLRLLLQLQLSPLHEIAWDGILATDQHLQARQTYFLLAGSRNVGVEHFVCVTLGRLVRQLKCRTRHLRAVSSSKIQGRIDWPDTFKARYSQDYDPTRYVCCRVDRQFDTPENQLLKLVVFLVQQSIAAVPEIIRAGVCYEAAPTSGGAPGSLPTRRRLDTMHDVLASLRIQVVMRDVTLPTRVDSSMLSRIAASRNELYHDVLKLYLHYDRVVNSRNWEHFAKCGKGGLPLPVNASSAGRPWIVLAAKALSHH